MCYACQSDPATWTWTDPAVRDLVTDLLTEWVDTGRVFTAYEVTATLRKSHPNTALPHSNGVREAVHSQMRDLLIQGQYTQRQVAFYRGGWAIQYVPVARKAPRRQPRRQPLGSPPAPFPRLAGA
nr:hypothetical protein [Chloroflexota bacterium]